MLGLSIQFSLTLVLSEQVTFLLKISPECIAIQISQNSAANLCSNLSFLFFYVAGLFPFDFMINLIRTMTLSLLTPSLIRRVTFSFPACSQSVF